MIYVYIVLVFAFFAVILWGIMCGHHLLQRQRYLNMQWGVVGEALAERNGLLGELQGLWALPGVAAVPEPARQALQELLVQDATVDWADVPARARLHGEMERVAQQLLADAQQQPAIAQNVNTGRIMQLLRDNAAVLEKNISNYNKSVRIYNAMLEQSPYHLIARKIGLEKAPLYN